MLVAAMPASAGVIMEMTHRDLGDPQSQPSIQRSYFQDGKFRVELGGADANRVTLFKDQAMYVINPVDKSYHVIDQATLQPLAARMAEARQRMEERIATMPPQQQEMMRKMLEGSGAGPPAQLTDAGRTEVVGGRTCHIWQRTRNGVVQSELCVVPAASLPGGAQLFQGLTSVSKFMDSLGKVMPRGMTQGDNFWADLMHTNGFPVMTREVLGGKATSETELTAIHQESLPPALFEVPAGYQEKSLNLGGGAPE
jgi:hypothetical protein